MVKYYLRVALHNASRNKALTSLMVLSLAVGIGASMTALTVMHLLSGDPMPGKSGQLFYPQVDVNPKSEGREPYDVMDYRTAHDLWSAGVADQQTMVVPTSVKISSNQTGATSVMISSLSTTSDFFSMFDVPFAYGGPWAHEDDQNKSRVVVISSRLNQQLFGGIDSVGQTIRIKDTNVHIVGVLAPWRPSPVFYKVRGGRFSSGGTSGFYGAADELFLPLSASMEIIEGDFQPFTCWATPERQGVLQNSPCVAVGVWIRLNGKDRVETYRRYLANYAAEQVRMGRVRHSNNIRMRSLMEWLEFNQVVPSDVKVMTILSFTFLLICLANMAGLLLAKFMRHSSELGLRRALGASRFAIYMQCLVEAALIGVLGGIAGLFLTLLGLWVVRMQPVAYADLARMDLTMFMFTFVLSLLTSVLAGAVPAIRAGSIQPVAQLKLI